MRGGKRGDLAVDGGGKERGIDFLDTSADEEFEEGFGMTAIKVYSRRGAAVLRVEMGVEIAVIAEVERVFKILIVVREGAVLGFGGI